VALIAVRLSAAVNELVQKQLAEELSLPWTLHTCGIVELSGSIYFIVFLFFSCFFWSFTNRVVIVGCRWL